MTTNPTSTPAPSFAPSAVPVDEIVALLEKCKQEHYSEYTGLYSCPAPDFGCECGAAEINAEINAMIQRLKNA